MDDLMNSGVAGASQQADGTDPKKNGNGDKAAADAASGKAAKAFSQADVDRIVGERLAREREKLEQEKNALNGRIQELSAALEQSSKRVAEAEARVESLEKQLLSPDESVEQRFVQLKQELAAKVEQAQAQAEHFKQLYTEHRIKAEIMDAARAAKAVNPAQVYALLAGATVLEPVLDEAGAATGDFRVMTAVVVEEEGAIKEKRLPTAEAVKLFLEQTENHNLVQGAGGSGGGAPGAAAAAAVNISELSPVERLKRHHSLEYNY